MNRYLCLLLGLLGSFLGAEDPPPFEPSAKDAAMEALFSAHADNLALESAIGKARKAGLQELVILDARYYDAVSRNNMALLESLAPELETAAANFKAADAVNFTKADDYRALAAHARALVAHAKGDSVAFRKELLDAVWLSPENATLFLENLMEHRRKEALAKMRVDLALTLDQEGGEPLSLKAAFGTNQVLVLDFWASWCAPCMESMEGLSQKAAWLARHGISLASINLDREEQKESVTKTRKKFPVAIPWLMEPEEAPLSQDLAIDSIPRFVVVKPDGSILFNGHPEDPDFIKALRVVVPNLPDEDGELPPEPETAPAGPDSIPVPGTTTGTIEIRPAEPVTPTPQP